MERRRVIHGHGIGFKSARAQTLALDYFCWAIIETTPVHLEHGGILRLPVMINRVEGKLDS
jgi:hypothetical protein